MSAQRILIMHASRLDSTAGVAAFLGEVLSAAGCSVDVVALGEEVDVRRYDRVVLGSAIRYDRWLPEAVAFAEANRAALSERPVHAFFTCLVLARRTPAAEEKATVYATHVADHLPVAVDQVGRFAGVLDCGRARWPVSWMLRLLSVFTGVRDGDYRDWSAIRDWALRTVRPGCDEAELGKGHPSATPPGETLAASFSSTA